MISIDSVVKASKDQISSDLAGETIILALNRGQYFGLDGVGARIWQLMAEPRPIDEIRDRLIREYDVPPERCQKDLLELLQEMESEGLIEVEGGTAP